jgi:outer membrane receptor protein involved in Fe transport
VYLAIERISFRSENAGDAVTRKLLTPLAAQIVACLVMTAPIAGEAATGDAAGGAENAEVPGGQLQEITVTAQKRTEDIKDIPFSVSAISGADLQEHHVADYDDLTRALPGISFEAGPGPGLDTIEIRGVSSQSGSATVGIYVDEVSVTVNNSQYDGAVQPKLFDLDRVEVLRGPQGTLYGASSMGGTIRFITKQPDLDAFSAGGSTDLSVTHHGGFNNDEYGILNIPVINGVFALRIGADLSNESGYIDHYVPTPTGAGADGSVLSLGTNDSSGVLGERGVNDIRTQVFRVTGKVAAPDDWTLTPAYMWQRTAASDTNIFYPDIGLYDQDKRVAEPSTDIWSLPSLTITKSFGWADLTSITSYFKRDFRRVTDGTLYNSNIFANDYVVAGLPTTPNASTPVPSAPQIYATQTVLGFLPSPANYDARTEQFSQEIRLSSKNTSIAGVATTWTAGLYFSNQHRRFLDDEYIPGVQAQFLNIFHYGIDSAQSVVGPTYYPATAAFPAESFANDLIYFGHTYPTQRQIAPFGELGVEITPQLKAAVGVRYVSAKSTEITDSGGFYAYGLPAEYPVSAKYSATTPKFSLEYAINASSNVYATIAKGFRLGGPTGPDPAYQPQGPPPATPGPCDSDYQSYGLTGAPKEYQSDWLWSYEIGSKGRYFSNRLSIDAAVYTINWSNIQQTINLPTCGYLFTTNVGDAKIYGSELEVRALVTSGLTLSLNAGSTHAYIASVSTEGTGIVSVGESVTGVPAYTATPSIDYEAPIGDGMTWFARTDFPYTGRSRGYFDSSGLSHLFQPAYGILNMSAGFTRNGLSLSLYAKNLLNWKNIIQYPSVNSVQEGYTVRPMTVGLMATFQM